MHVFNYESARQGMSAMGCCQPVWRAAQIKQQHACLLCCQRSCTHPSCCYTILALSSTSMRRPCELGMSGMHTALTLLTLKQPTPKFTRGPNPPAAALDLPYRALPEPN